MSSNRHCLRNSKAVCSQDPKGHWASTHVPGGMPRGSNGSESCAGLLKKVVAGWKRLIAVFFFKLAARAEARSLKLSANLVVDPARYGPKKNTHAKKRARSTHEKAQTEDFRGLIEDQCTTIITPSGVHRKTM